MFLISPADSDLATIVSFSSYLCCSEAYELEFYDSLGTSLNETVDLKSKHKDTSEVAKIHRESVV
jgi:hypothetical protein